MGLFECRGVVKRYGAKTALNGVDLELQEGKIVGLLGPNGSGKTTMIKLANGLLRPTEGKVLIEGKEPSPETKAKIAYLPDKDFLPSYMTVGQLMDFYGDFYADFNVAKAEKMLEGLELSKEDVLKKMSKGTKEKIQLILVMSRDARIYFLDEPIAGVDPAARDYILKTIISNYCENSLVIISTHLIADIESVLDEVVFIKNGRVILHKEADVLREEKGKNIDGLFREVFKC
ncbi:MAG: ABC transporter ATP-binding protein [Anaerovoracaceae bacterium]